MCTAKEGVAGDAFQFVHAKVNCACVKYKVQLKVNSMKQS